MYGGFKTPASSGREPSSSFAPHGSSVSAGTTGSLSAIGVSPSSESASTRLLKQERSHGGVDNNINHLSSSSSTTDERFLSMEKSSSTIHSNISVKYDIHATGLSVDATGSYGVLASRKGLHLVDLEAPYISTYTLHHQTKWEVVVVKCNPHVPFKSHVASTSNHNTLIWNLHAAGNSLMHNHGNNNNNSNHDNGNSNQKTTSSSQPLVATLRAHTRPVSDLAWSPSEPMLLATCSADTKTHLWDIRTPQQPVQTFSAFTTSATQVEWNRVDPTSLATAHDGEVRVWDTRASEKAPAVIITAHMQKIHGIDWHPQRMYELVTCSEDKTVKLWNVTQPRQCQGTLTTGAPVWRARYTPFGDGLVTISHRLDNTLRLWSLSYAHPHSDSVGIGVDQVYAFSGHNDLVRAFAWRSRPNAGVYQLVSWSKSQELRMWRIDSQHLEACGYETNWMETLPSMPEDVLRTDSIHKQRASKYDLGCLKNDFQPLVVPTGATPLALCEYNINHQVPVTESMAEEESLASRRARLHGNHRWRIRSRAAKKRAYTKGKPNKSERKLGGFGRMTKEEGIEEEENSDEQSVSSDDEDDTSEDEDDSDEMHSENDEEQSDEEETSLQPSHQQSMASRHRIKTRKGRKTKPLPAQSKSRTTWASCLPCPRISGACFSGPNMLVVFDSRVAIGQTRKSSGTGRVLLPRTYEELLDLRDSRFTTKYKKFNKKISNEMLFLYGKAPRSSTTVGLSGDWSGYDSSDWMGKNDPSAHGVLGSLATNGATGGTSAMGMQLSAFSHAMGGTPMTSTMTNSLSHGMMLNAAAASSAGSNEGETVHGGSEYLKTYFNSAEFHLPVNHPDHRISVPSMDKTLSSQALAPGAPLTPKSSTIRATPSKRLHRHSRAETASSLSLDLSLSVTLLDLSTLCGVSTELMYGTLLGTSCNQSGTKSKTTGIMTTNAMTILDSILKSSKSSRSSSPSNTCKISEICALNSQRACMANRFDLSLVWCLLAATTNEFEVHDPSDDTKNPLMHLATRWPWKMHPFGKCLVEKILQMYENIGDLPSLASIVCALDAVKLDAEEPPVSNNKNELIATRPTAPRRSISSSGATSKQRISNAPRVANEWPLVTAPSASSPPKPNPVADNISKFLPVMSDRVESSLRTWAGSSSKESSPRRLTVNTFVPPDPSPPQQQSGAKQDAQDHIRSDTDITIVTSSEKYNTQDQLVVGSDRIVLALEPLHVEEENAMLSSTATDVERYDIYKKSYGELLYRYGAMNRRTEVLKRLSQGDKQHEGISFGIICPKCTQQCESLYCSYCNDFAVKCSVCQLVVRGQSMFCMSCGHGGHVSHLREWFAKENACPTGCGCWCKQATSTFNFAKAKAAAAVAAAASAAAVTGTSADKLDEPSSRSYSL